MPYALWVASDNRFAFSADNNGGVPITQAAFDALFAGQTAGQVIANDGAGNPVLQAPAAPSPAFVAMAAAAALQAGGLTITCTSTPAINGVYAADAAAWASVTAIIAGISTNGTFPMGRASWPWLLADKVTWVTFPSVALFKEFATALEGFVGALTLYAAGDPGAALPSASATLA